MAINLEKGQRINLEKSNGTKLNNICVGVNWGAIERKGLFGNDKAFAGSVSVILGVFTKRITN